MRRNLTYGILLAGGVLLVLVAALGVLTVSNIIRLEQTSRRIADDALAEQQLLNQFQTALNDAVIHAASYARSRQQGSLQNARDALAEARQLLPKWDSVTNRANNDGFAADRQAQRIALVNDAEAQVERLDQALANGDAARVIRSLQRLELVTQDTATLARSSRRLSSQQTATTIEAGARQVQQGLYSTIGVFALLAGAVLSAVLAARAFLVRPLRQLRDTVQLVGGGDFEQRLLVTSQNEVGQLQAGVNAMAEGLQRQQAALVARTAALEQLSQQQAELLETINALGTPILPVLPEVLVLPVVGHVDAIRAKEMSGALLDAVHAQRARIAILDVTGMATRDASAIPLLLDIVAAVELLGAQVFVAGIGPAFALQMAAHADTLANLKTFRTLRDAVQAVVQANEDRTALRA